MKLIAIILTAFSFVVVGCEAPTSSLSNLDAGPSLSTLGKKGEKSNNGEKVGICHAIGRVSDGTVLNHAGINIPEGAQICIHMEVTKAALQAHCGHGDRTLPEGWLDEHPEARMKYGFFRPGPRKCTI